MHNALAFAKIWQHCVVVRKKIPWIAMRRISFVEEGFVDDTFAFAEEREQPCVCVRTTVPSAMRPWTLPTQAAGVQRGAWFCALVMHCCVTKRGPFFVGLLR